MYAHPLHAHKQWLDSLTEVRKLSLYEICILQSEVNLSNPQEIIFALQLEKYLNRTGFNLLLQAENFRLS